MPSYILRTIDPDLWARVKARSEADGIPMRAIILKLLEMYASGRIDIKADHR